MVTITDPENIDNRARELAWIPIPPTSVRVMATLSAKDGLKREKKHNLD